MIRLGRSTYNSKEQLKAEVRSFLWLAPSGSISDPDMHDKVNQLLLLHPNAARKIGCGVKEIVVAKNEMGSGKGFMVVRKDGTEVRFSYKRCIDGKVATTRFNAVEAMRFLVRPQIIEFRSKIKLPVKCTITGSWIQNHQEMHIDHTHPFWMLVHDFCHTFNIDLTTIETRGSGEHLCLADSDLAISFFDYHRTFAELRPTLKVANLNKGGQLNTSTEEAF